METTQAVPLKKPVRFTQAVKDQWVAALRSGDYRQGCYRMYDPKTGCFCALGVLADLNDQLDGLGMDRDTGSPAEPFISGLTKEESYRIIGWSDVENLPFPRIAELVEKYIKPVRGT